jgi:hypothetical protein
VSGGNGTLGATIDGRGGSYVTGGVSSSVLPGGSAGCGVVVPYGNNTVSDVLSGPSVGGSGYSPLGLGGGCTGNAAGYACQVGVGTPGVSVDGTHTIQTNPDAAPAAAADPAHADPGTCTQQDPHGDGSGTGPTSDASDHSNDGTQAASNDNGGAGADPSHAEDSSGTQAADASHADDSGTQSADASGSGDASGTQLADAGDSSGGGDFGGGDFGGGDFGGDAAVA